VVRKALTEQAAAPEHTNTKEAKDAKEVKDATAKDPDPAPIIRLQTATPSTNFRHYLEPSILRLDAPRALSGILEAEAERMGNLLDELGVCPETTPPSLAACSILLACQKMGVPKVPTDVASVCSISVATLQKCMKRIEPWRSVLYGETGIPPPQ
jgi:hypothetical protein